MTYIKVLCKKYSDIGIPPEIFLILIGMNFFIPCLVSIPNANAYSLTRLKANVVGRPRATDSINPSSVFTPPSACNEGRWAKHQIVNSGYKDRCWWPWHVILYPFADIYVITGSFLRFHWWSPSANLGMQSRVPPSSASSSMKSWSLRILEVGREHLLLIPTEDSVTSS